MGSRGETAGRGSAEAEEVDMQLVVAEVVREGERDSGGGNSLPAAAPRQEGLLACLSHGQQMLA